MSVISGMRALGSAESEKRYVPVYPSITWTKQKKEKALDKSLAEYVEENMVLESEKEMKRRDGILMEIKKLFVNFVKEVAITKNNMSEEEAERAGGDLAVSGSHRLRVRDVGADIDTICIAPNFVTREHFFTIFKSVFMSHPKVEDFSSIESANVPIMAFDFDGISIDLLFARLSTNIVRKGVDLLDDNILTNIDQATEKTLNGPRVTKMIPLLANRSKDAEGNITEHKAYASQADVANGAPETFLIVLRCIRRWAKAKGLYGNKMGYLGGINCNLLVAMICQLYPNATPSTLLRFFFQTYTYWKWPKPVQLNSIQPNPAHLKEEDKKVIWDSSQFPYNRDLMPIITPAYPAMNSSMSVNEHTRTIMENEFRYGYEICKQIVKGEATWGKLFQPSDFYIRYNHYLCINIVGTGDNIESRSWIGFVESFLRGFPQYLRVLPIANPIHLYPVQNKTTKSDNSICYFIGFNVDREKFKPDKPLNIDICANKFRTTLITKYEDRNGTLAEGLDLFIDHHPWKKLPKEVFDVYGGMVVAKEMRKEAGFGKYGEKLKREEEEAAAAAATAATAEDAAGDGDAGGDTTEEAEGEGGQNDNNNNNKKVEETKEEKKNEENKGNVNKKRKLSSGYGTVVDPALKSRPPPPATTLFNQLPQWKETNIETETETMEQQHSNHHSMRVHCKDIQWQ